MANNNSPLRQELDTIEALEGVMATTFEEQQEVIIKLVASLEKMTNIALVAIETIERLEQQESARNVYIKPSAHDCENTSLNDVANKRRQQSRDTFYYYSISVVVIYLIAVVFLIIIGS